MLQILRTAFDGLLAAASLFATAARAEIPAADDLCGPVTAACFDPRKCPNGTRRGPSRLTRAVSDVRAMRPVTAVCRRPALARC